MSFELWLTCYQNGSSHEFARATFDRLAEPYLTYRNDKFVCLDFWKGMSLEERPIIGFHQLADGTVRNAHILNECEIYIKGSEGTSHLTVLRPVNDIKLYAILFDILKQTTSVLYWPGCSRVIVASLDAGAHIPCELIEALGPCVVVFSADELKAAVSLY
jgi:hypothetical protein